MLARLRHRAVGGAYHQHRAVHLRRARNHVLYIIGVAGTIYVGVVAVGGLVFNMGGRNGDAARALLGGVVYLIKALALAAVFIRQHLGHGRRQRGLAVVYVADCSHVYVRLGSFEFCFGHFLSPETNFFWVVFSQAALMASATPDGTGAYFLNSMVWVARPWVAERNAVA